MIDEAQTGVDYLGLRIKKLRERAGLSQRELSLMASMSCAFLCQVETNPKRSMTAEKLYRIARALKISTDCLLEGLYSDPQICRKRTICVTDADFARIEKLLADETP